MLDQKGSFVSHMTLYDFSRKEALWAPPNLICKTTAKP